MLVTPILMTTRDFVMHPAAFSPTPTAYHDDRQPSDLGKRAFRRLSRGSVDGVCAPRSWAMRSASSSDHLSKALRA